MTISSRLGRTTSTAARSHGLLAALEASFAEALRTPEGTAEPAALLWTDAEAHWKPLVERLRSVMPQVYQLGNYAPDKRTGPAIWLRCVVDGALPDVEFSAGVIPILYLPGVSRQDLRAGSECPKAVQPLVELQYRGRVWHQRNGRDWTVEAFLTSEDGLGLDIAQDARTREAILRSLALLAEAPIEGLRGRRLDADDFDALAVTDPIRDLLRWMGAVDASRGAENENKWRSFCSVCKSELGFDPDRQSPRDAANLLIEGRGRWDGVWDRFREAPKLYPGVAQVLRDLPGQLKLGFDVERSPHANDAGELQLRKALHGIADLPHAKAIETLLALEADHGGRREWVWAELGESPLAVALEPLARVAALSKTALGGASLDAVINGYTTDGWRCDRAALESLSSVRTAADLALVGRVVKGLYGPWLDESARHFQKLVSADEGAAHARVGGTSQEKDVCVVFADGLRFDVAKTLQERLETRGVRVRVTHRLAPLPTVTATAKPIATLVHDALVGDAGAGDFVPQFRAGGQAATVQRLRDEMTKRGADVLGDEIRPARTGMTSAWLEAGRFDELGHKLGAQLAFHLDTELDHIVEQITALLDCGWLRIRIVTDHGWLLLPGGLPKVELPAYLVATRWARCASVRGASATTMPIYGWHWNRQVRIASPPGVACFTSNNEYTHGGVSPQECIVPELVVERGDTLTRVSITGVSWRGMRCRVSVDTNDPAVRVDLRLNWKQSTTSIAVAAKEVGPAGEASLAVEDDSNEGAAATVVVIDAAGTVLDRKPTTVGDPK